MTVTALKYQVVVSSMFQENAFLIHVAEGRECLIVDPGLDDEKIIERIQTANLEPVAILNTHGHADHIAGNQAMKQQFPACPLIIGRGDEDKLTDPVKNLSAPFGIGLTSPPADRTVVGGDVLQLAGMELEVLETPGHSRGHVVFLCKQCDPWVVVGGDVLFREGIGRTDFPDGSFAELEASIREKLFPLPDSTIVLTGHGPETTIGHERRYNPFVRDVES